MINIHPNTHTLHASRLASMACTDKGPGVDLVVKDASVPEPMKISVALDQSSPWIELGIFETNSA